jgi:hypothetical protein
MRRRAVLAMASTASGGVGLLAIAWLAARRLTSAELGFFFSYLSFGALMQLGDFGLSYATLQAAGALAGSGRGHELASLERRVVKWNLLATAIAAVFVTLLGWATFSFQASTSTVAWRAPWFAYVLAVVGSQLTMPRISLREGGGRIEQMWTLRLAQELAGCVACLLALHAGAALYSIAAYAGVRALVAATWLTFGDRLRHHATVGQYTLQRWMAEVWPFQWKIALSGLSGFLIFRSFSPIVLLEKGPVAAGQFGLAISFMNLLIAVTTAWPLSQAAHYAALNASGGHAELRRSFPTMLWASSAFSVMATAILVAGLAEARVLGISVALRLPDMTTTTFILATAIIHHFVACFAVFLRAEGREPLLVASVAGSIGTVAIVWATAHIGSFRDIAIANFFCTIVGIPVVLFLFRLRIGRLNALTS